MTDKAPILEYRSPTPEPAARHPKRQTRPRRWFPLCCLLIGAWAGLFAVGSGDLLFAWVALSCAAAGTLGGLALANADSDPVPLAFGLLNGIVIPVFLSIHVC